MLVSSGDTITVLLTHQPWFPSGHFGLLLLGDPHTQRTVPIPAGRADLDPKGRWVTLAQGELPGNISKSQGCVLVPGPSLSGELTGPRVVAWKGVGPQAFRTLRDKVCITSPGKPLEMAEVLAESTGI